MDRVRSRYGLKLTGLNRQPVKRDRPAIRGGLLGMSAIARVILSQPHQFVLADGAL